MSLWRLAWRNLHQHSLSTAVTALVCALAGGLVMAVFIISQQARTAFTQGGSGYEAVLGARGSQIQLVLNAVFHLETSPGNIPWTLYQQVAKSPGVERAVPLGLGDSYRGYRVAGTTLEFFTDPPVDSTKYEVEGRFFATDRQEAVLGSTAAHACGLHLGDTFHPYHGLAADAHQHDESYVVVGILKPTNTPVDRVLWIPLEGIFRMSGHVLRGDGEEYEAQAGVPIPEENLEVSAVLLDLKNPQVGFQLDQTINRQGKVATLAFPIGRTVAEIFQKLGWAEQLLALVCMLTMVVAAAAILAAIYNTIAHRKLEFAVLRALGMSAPSLFSLIVLEATLIALAGAALSYLVFAAIFSGAAWTIWEQTGLVLQLTFHPALLLAPLAMVGLGAAAGLLPAWRAFSGEVAESLR